MRHGLNAGRTLLSALLLACAAAAPASAQTVGVYTSDGPFVGRGAQTEEEAETLTAFGETITCTGVTLTLAKYGVTPHEAVPSGSSTATVAKHTGQCEAEGLFTTVEPNGCDQSLHIKETTGFQFLPTYGVTTTYGCSEGNHVRLTVFSGEAELLRLCTLTITENESGYEGLHLTDLGGGAVRLHGTAEGLAIHKSGLCGAGSDSEGALDVDFTIEALDEEGESTGFSLSD